MRIKTSELTEQGLMHVLSLPDLSWQTCGPIIDREITKIFRNVGGTWSAMILKDVPIPPEDRGTSLALTRRAQWNGAGPHTPDRCYALLL